MASGLQRRCAAKSFSVAIQELANIVQTLELLHESELLAMTSTIADLRAEKVMNASSDRLICESDVEFLVDRNTLHKSVPRVSFAGDLGVASVPEHPDALGNVASGTIAEKASSEGIVNGTGLGEVDATEAETKQQVVIAQDILSTDVVESPNTKQTIAEGRVSEKDTRMEDTLEGVLEDVCDPSAVTTEHITQPFCDRMQRAKAKLSMHSDISDEIAAEPLVYRVLGRTATFDAQDQKGQSALLRLLTNPMLDISIALMIVANSIIMGIEVQDAFTSRSPNVAYAILDVFFNTIFVFELLLRIAGFGCRCFFLGEDASWNIFDCFLIGIGWFGILSGLVTEGDGQMENAKAFKMLRVLRLFRMFRFFRQLATLTMMVLSSMQQLFWALILFGIIVYIVALTLSDGAAQWLRAETRDFTLGFSVNSKVEAVHKRFGGVPSSCYTLFQVALGGVNWGEVTDVTIEIGWIYMVVLSSYITFAVIAVLNVFTGVFVEEALQQKQKQLDILIEDKMKHREHYMTQIQDFFSVVDEDGDGNISLEEVKEMMGDPSLSAYFDVLGFKTKDASKVFELLDVDGSGSIGSAELIEGCENITGAARGIDLHVALIELRRLKAVTRKTLEALTGENLRDTVAAR